MAKSGGIRTVAVTIRLTPAEFACFEAVRASQVFPQSQADWLSGWVLDTCERIARNASLTDAGRRCAAALQAFDAEREKRHWTGAGRPPRPRRTVLS